MDPGSFSLIVMLFIMAIFFVAGLVHGILGLGFPLLATPLVAILFDVRSAILLTLLPTITVNLISILRGGRWSESIGRYWPLVIMMPLGAVLGTWLLARVDPAPFRLLLAAMILLHLFNERHRTVRMNWVHDHLWLGYFVFGIAAGFSAGTVNVTVPVLIIFALQINMPRLVMVQVFNLCFLVGKTSQAAAFAYAGMFGTELVLGTLPFAAAGAAGLALGMFFSGRVRAETYQRWLRWVLLIIAVVLIGQFFARWG